VVAESGDFKSANLILQMMESMGSPPSTSTYIALIEGYNTWGMPKEALGVFQSMLKQGITVDDTTFAFLLKGCIQVGAAPVVERLWQEFVERRGIRAGRYSWHFRIQALASFDMVAALNLALDLLSDQRPDRMEIISLAMFTHIITAYFKAGAISLQQSESYLKWLRIARSPITPQTRRRQGWIYKRLGEILPPNPGVIDDLREMLEYCVEGHREMPATTPQAEVTVEPQPQGS
jgi:pentatricopeptide repeat protein